MPKNNLFIYIKKKIFFFFFTGVEMITIGKDIIPEL